ncbi:hypothetical protein [Candidatus Berkiella aquae]|uniref:Uncharacterized protein n=1 Tax=Candidatus Berkiella aquae TaxID=295108 RepID=A0A0Q9YKQ2_9GAMM|nr:hypothetical protein [Candidatus Berkiella aquae]MCS5710861.1 hypothetical protein [Candidatus Berkiella aquae]
MINSRCESEENALEDYGADIVSELFGEPQEPPNTLLWMANKIYHSLAYLAGYVQREEVSHSVAESRTRLSN